MNRYKEFERRRQIMRENLLGDGCPKFNLGDKVYGWWKRDFGGKNKNEDYQYSLLGGNINEIIIRLDKNSDRSTYYYGVYPFRRPFAEEDLFSDYDEALATVIIDFEFDF